MHPFGAVRARSIIPERLSGLIRLEWFMQWLHCCWHRCWRWWHRRQHWNSDLLVVPLCPEVLLHTTLCSISGHWFYVGCYWPAARWTALYFSISFFFIVVVWRIRNRCHSFSSRKNSPFWQRDITTAVLWHCQVGDKCAYTCSGLSQCLMELSTCFTAWQKLNQQNLATAVTSCSLVLFHMFWQ